MCFPFLNAMNGIQYFMFIYMFQPKQLIFHSTLTAHLFRINLERWEQVVDSKVIFTLDFLFGPLEPQTDLILDSLQHFNEMHQSGIH